MVFWPTLPITRVKGALQPVGGARGVKEFSHGFLSDDGVFLCDALNTH